MSKLIIAIAMGFIVHSQAFAAAPANLPTVVVRAAKLTEISHELSYPALVQAKVQATVLAQSDGVIRKIHALLGQPIKAGRHLVTIQQTDPIFQYAAVGTPSPVSGIVSELNVTEGALVNKGQKLASVTDPNSLKIVIEIPAQDLHLLQSGTTGAFATPALGQVLQLKLVGISPSVDIATGTASAELLPSTTDIKSLRQGMIGKVNFKANLHSGFMVPEDAIIQSQNETFLRVVQDGVSKKVAVTVGARMRGSAEIVKGLKAGDQVVERANGFIADGEAVKIENSQESKTQ